MLKRLYRQILHDWVSPVIHDPEREAEKRAKQANNLERQRKLALRQTKVEGEALQKKRDAESALLPGEKGFRRHAYIPTVAKLDYVHNPGREGGGGAGGGASGSGRRGRDEEDEENDGGFGAMAAVAREPGSGRAARGGGGGGPELDPLTRKMRERAKIHKGSTARAAKVSVEGRNITLM
jgi:hypothetical protein